MWLTVATGLEAMLPELDLGPSLVLGKGSFLFTRVFMQCTARRFIVLFLLLVDIILNREEPKYQFADAAFSTLRSVLTKQDSLFGRQSILLNVHLAITH